MRRSWWLWGVSLAVYALLYVPLAIVVVFSFNDSKLNAEWVGFTLSWYHTLFNDQEMLRAAANSLLIAVISSVAATVLGTMAGIAMHRYRPKLLPFMVLTPVAMPEILLGVSLLIFFISVFGQESLSLLTVILAHTTFCIGFVAIVVRARLAGMDDGIFEAARDLGATPWQTFRRVTLPLGKLEIQTDSSTVIQSGLPGTSKTASGLRLAIGMRMPEVFTPGRGVWAQRARTMSSPRETRVRVTGASYRTPRRGGLAGRRWHAAGERG